MAGTKIVVRWAKLVLDWYYVTACASIVSNLFSSKMYRFDSDSIMLPQHHLSDGFGVNINGWCPFGWKVSVLNSNFQSKFFSVPKKESRLWISKEKGQQSASKPFLACHRCVATANLALWLNHIQLFSSDQKNGAHFSVSFFLCHWFGNLISEFINVSQQLKLYTPFRWCRRCFRLFPSSIWIFSLVRFRSPQKKIYSPIFAYGISFRRTFDEITVAFFPCFPLHILLYNMIFNAKYLCECEQTASSSCLKHSWNLVCECYFGILESRQMKDGIQCFDIV